MKIYLVRHGKAFNKSDNPERSLTEEGKGEVVKVASVIKKSKIKLNTIFHSGKARAKETAELIAQFIPPQEGIYQSQDLEPMVEPSIWVDRIRNLKKDIMLVGHLPHLGRLVSLLLTNDEKEIINFAPVTIVCLSKEDENFSVDWVISPDICYNISKNFL